MKLPPETPEIALRLPSNEYRACGEDTATSRMPLSAPYE